MDSPIKWIGGKSKSLKYLLPQIPSHEGFVEVFGGAGWLLFGKHPSKWEVLNDLDNNLINFFNIIQNNHLEFIKSFDFELVSRSKFNEFKEIYKNQSYTDNIQRAHILYYLLKAGAGASLPDGGGCGYPSSKDCSRLRLDKLPLDIMEAHKRLLKVNIECLDFKKILKKYDSEYTFFYLDPPYRNTNRSSYPVGNFTDEDYIDLFNICSNIKGKFLLSINDDVFIKSLFSSNNKFYIEQLEILYSVNNKNKCNKHCELLISNYPLSTQNKNTNYIEKNIIEQYELQF